MSFLKAAGLVLLMVSAISAQPSSPGKVGAASPLSRVREEWARGFNAKNADAVLALYADDAIVVGSTGTFKGRDAIRTWVQAGIDQGSRLEPIQVIDEKNSGNLAYATGTSRRWVGQELHRGRYLLVMRKIGKDWKIVHHFSMNVAADAPQ